MSYLVYDADCGFCTRSANWIADGRNVTIRPWQGIPDLAGVGLNEDMVTQAAYWVSDDEPPLPGAEAIAAALIAAGGLLKVVGVAIRSAPVLPLARVIYKWVAANRYRMPGASDACKLP